jgi:endonuclease III
MNPARPMQAMPEAPAFAAVVDALGAHYGPLPDMPPRAIHQDPFALVLWEQVAYLATDAVRAAAFAMLERDVGLTPHAILAASPETLNAVCRAGGSIAAADRAERMRASARLVLAQWHGDASALLALPEDQARRALAKFRMIGEPGADKILALGGAGTRVPLDSNALRVLGRLHINPETADYRATYRAAQQALAPFAAQQPTARATAGALLRLHGQELCKRAAPRCAGCPLRGRCPSAEVAR